MRQGRREVASPPNPLSDPSFVAGLRPIPSGPLEPGSFGAAVDIDGVTPSGAPVSVRLDQLDGLVLLAFLATSCDGCDEFWDGFRSGGRYPAMSVIVTRGPASGRLVDVQAAARAIENVPVVMSDAAWEDYRVTAYPFFVLVDTDARAVVAETVGFGWADVLGMIRSAGGRSD